MPCCDSHFHADDFIDSGTIDEIITRAMDSDVSTLIAIGGSIEANQKASDLAKRYPGTVYATAGFDRDLAGTAPDFNHLRTQISAPEVCAVGESGLDYYYGRDSRDEQMILFNAMLELAVEFNKPIVVHTREADEDTAACLQAYVDKIGGRKNPGVIHCFTGTLPFALQMIELGFYISFSGIVTFRKAEELREVAKQLPLDRILIETDAPYLAPVPNRGKTNEPAWVVHVAETLAKIRGETVDMIAGVTTDNAQNLFGY